MFETSVPNKGINKESYPVIQNLRPGAEPLAHSISGSSSVLKSLSREMRTQMNSIVAYSFLINKKEYGDTDRAEFTDQIHYSCEQIINLFDNFLDSSIIDNDNLGSVSGKLNPGPFFEELFSEFRTALNKNRYKDILYVSEIQEFIPAVYATDTNRLARVIRNLFQNAVANTKAGYIKVGIKLKNDRLIFSILDSGYGFLKSREFLQNQDISDALSKINDIYPAVNLALTRKLVKIIDGIIWIERNGLAGTSIYFSIPAVEAVISDEPADKLSNTMIPI
jgi:K+-sensing histidine kinase KdpD